MRASRERNELEMWKATPPMKSLPPQPQPPSFWTVPNIMIILIVVAVSLFVWIK